MIYPGIVLFLGVVVIMVMSYTLVPAVAKLYGSFGSDLPFATKVMMALSNALTTKPYLALVPIVGMWALFKYLGGKSAGSQQFRSFGWSFQRWAQSSENRPLR